MDATNGCLLVARLDTHVYMCILCSTPFELLVWDTAHVSRHSHVYAHATVQLQHVRLRTSSLSFMHHKDLAQLVV